MQVGTSNSAGTRLKHTQESRTVYSYGYCSDVCVWLTQLLRLRCNNCPEQTVTSGAGNFKSRYSSVGKVTSARLSNSALSAR
jgi:hypothetical protein